uniref:Uncharacterized protein n=1 Tax=Glossina pallidipes TaxID=7398 RepID=A0A1B0AGX1_GLOPL
GFLSYLIVCLVFSELLWKKRSILSIEKVYRRASLSSYDLGFSCYLIYLLCALSSQNPFEKTKAGQNPFEKTKAGQAGQSCSVFPIDKIEGKPSLSCHELVMVLAFYLILSIPLKKPKPVKPASPLRSFTSCHELARCIRLIVLYSATWIPSSSIQFDMDH